MRMEPEPTGYYPDEDIEFTEEEIRAGGRNIIIAFAPVIDEYGPLLQGPDRGPVPDVELSAPLLEVASELSRAGPGNVHYEAHVEYLQRLVSVLELGGSVVSDGEIAAAALGRARKFPERLFENLDKDWLEYARKGHAGDFGLVVPPVLGIVLTRCATREAIPYVLRDLRDEWDSARTKVWDLIDGLRVSRTVGEANEISRQLADASKYFSPAGEGYETRPMQVFWELVSTATAGAVIAGLTGGRVQIGALAGLVGQAARTISQQGDFARVLFGMGAFDLARRIRTETMKNEPDALARILTDSEKQTLGL